MNHYVISIFLSQLTRVHKLGSRYKQVVSFTLISTKSYFSNQNFYMNSPLINFTTLFALVHISREYLHEELSCKKKQIYGFRKLKVAPVEFIKRDLKLQVSLTKLRSMKSHYYTYYFSSFNLIDLLL